MVGLKSQNADVAHLLRRAGFDGTPAELKYYESLGYKGTLDELLNPEKVANSKLEDGVAQQNFDFTAPDDLRRWWIYRMCFTNRPLEEKMTLFWHGHFATGMRKVGRPYDMYLQNVLFRKQCLGNFHDLLMAVSKDPAMILWLDNQQNRKGKPNENYAREVMELFTMGIGNYSEQDIKEAARAFTGWQTRPDGYFFNPRQHDFGPKTVLGHTGEFNGDDIIDILAQQPATAKRLSRKLIKFFVFEDPSDSMINAVADSYMSSMYQIKPMLRTIFTHPDFLSEKAYHAHIKSPVELVIGTHKVLQIQKLDNDLPATLAKMGQNLFEPPNVKGWDGGPAWISTDTMMERFNFANRMTGERFDQIEGYSSPSQLMYDQKLKTAGQMVDYFLRLLVDADVPDSTRNRLVAYASSDIQGNPVEAIPGDTELDTKLRGLVRLIMSLPTYQLA